MKGARGRCGKVKKAKVPPVTYGECGSVHGGCCKTRRGASPVMGGLAVF